MRKLTDYQHPLRAPLELVKDQSVLKGRVIAATLVVGHPLFYWAWTRLDPQPYESLVWRAVAALLGLAALVAMLRLGANDRRSAWAYGIATTFGTVVLASWFYVANGGNTVWLASLSVMTMLYFTLTDWRIATAVTVVTWTACSALVWSFDLDTLTSGDQHPFFTLKAFLILGFTLAVSILTRYTDMSMRAVRMRSQMRALGLTAHEVRTPIAGMQLLSSALQERLNDAKADKVTAADLQDMRELVSDLVQACVDANASIETHLANANPFKPFARRSPISVGEVSRAAIATFQRAAGSRERLVDLQVLRDFCIVADAGVLQQVIVNLLNNSLKAVVLRHRGPAPGQIRVAVDYSGAGRLTVSDHGGGIKKEDLAKIFEPFHTGDPEQGHGLGLTFVESVVTVYGGSIEAKSRDGNGTTMTITFPGATPT